MPILARGLVLVALAGTAQAQVESIERGWRDESWPVRERASEQAIDAWADWSVEDLARLETLPSDLDSEVADRAGKALARIRIRRELGEPLVRRGLDADVLAGESGGVAALRRPAGRGTFRRVREPGCGK